MTDRTPTAVRSAGQNPYEHLRRSPRFKACDNRAMTVVIERAAGCEPRKVRGTILDLSLGGAKLAVPAEVGLQEKVTVRWDVEQIDPYFTVPATVCWARTAGGNSWRLGCSFEKQLPETLISELALHGYIDRRESGREPVTVTAAVQWETNQQIVAVRVQDLSSGGFSLLCDEFAATDSRCRLIVSTAEGETIVVPARVEWQRKTSEGYVLGCAYLETDAHRTMERTLGRQLAGAVPEAATARQPAEPKTATSLVDLVRRDRGFSPRLVARRSRRTLLAAALALGAALVLSRLADTAGFLGWASAVAAMLVAAACAGSYHRLTRQVAVLAGLHDGPQS